MNNNTKYLYKFACFDGERIILVSLNVNKELSTLADFEHIRQYIEKNHNLKDAVIMHVN